MLLLLLLLVLEKTKKKKKRRKRGSTAVVNATAASTEEEGGKIRQKVTQQNVPHAQSIGDNNLEKERKKLSRQNGKGREGLAAVIAPAKPINLPSLGNTLLG